MLATYLRAERECYKICMSTSTLLTTQRPGEAAGERGAALVVCPIRGACRGIERRRPERTAPMSRSTRKWQSTARTPTTSCKGHLRGSPVRALPITGIARSVPAQWSSWGSEVAASFDVAESGYFWQASALQRRWRWAGARFNRKGVNSCACVKVTAARPRAGTIEKQCEPLLKTAG